MQRFVLASTGGIYARSREPIPEDGEIDPQDVYFSSKREAELRLEAAPGDLVPIALRPFFVYGTGQRRMLIARLVHRVQAGEEIVISGYLGAQQPDLMWGTLSPRSPRRWTVAPAAPATWPATRRSASPSWSRWSAKQWGASHSSATRPPRAAATWWPTTVA